MISHFNCLEKMRKYKELKMKLIFSGITSNLYNGCKQDTKTGKEKRDHFLNLREDQNSIFDKVVGNKTFTFRSSHYLGISELSLFD